LDRDGIASYAQPLIDAFNKIANEDHRGTHLADEIHHPPTKPPRTLYLSDPVYQLLVSFLNQRYQTNYYTTIRNGPWFVPQTVLGLDKLSIRGVVYASAESLPRDSNVIFRKPGDPTLRIGKINMIFCSSHCGANYQETKVTCLVVEEWLPVMDPAAQKSYQQFGFAGGFLCQNRAVETVTVIEDGDVVCHFAKTFLGQKNSERFHALPLNKVRGSRCMGLSSYPNDLQMLDSYTIPLGMDLHLHH
jgi:hypothetical protein